MSGEQHNARQMSRRASRKAEIDSRAVLQTAHAVDAFSGYGIIEGAVARRSIESMDCCGIHAETPESSIPVNVWRQWKWRQRELYAG